MDVSLLVIPECPHAEPAASLLRMVLDSAGMIHQPFATTVIGTPEQAEEHGFLGSPSFLINGVDAFADSGTHTPPTPSVACRIYPTPGGLHGLPVADELEGALRRAHRAEEVSR